MRVIQKRRSSESMVYASLAVLCTPSKCSLWRKSDQNLHFASFVIVYVCLAFVSCHRHRQLCGFVLLPLLLSCRRCLVNLCDCTVNQVTWVLSHSGESRVSAWPVARDCHLPIIIHLSPSASASPLHIRPESSQMRAWTPKQTIYVHVNYFYLAAAYARSLDFFFFLCFSFAKC